MYEMGLAAHKTIVTLCRHVRQSILRISVVWEGKEQSSKTKNLNLRKTSNKMIEGRFQCGEESCESY